MGISNETLSPEFQDGYTPSENAVAKDPEFLKMFDDLQKRMTDEAAIYSSSHIAKKSIEIIYMSIASKYTILNTEVNVMLHKVIEKNKILIEALLLIKNKSPRCACMDAPGIASDALEKVGE